MNEDVRTNKSVVSHEWNQGAAEASMKVKTLAFGPGDYFADSPEYKVMTVLIAIEQTQGPPKIGREKKASISFFFFGMPHSLLRRVFIQDNISLRFASSKGGGVRIGA